MHLDFYELTSTGDRDANQDYMAHLVNEQFGLFIVADGLGGHQGGEKASKYFCEAMLKYAGVYQKRLREKKPSDVFLIWIDKAIDEMRVLFNDDILAANAYTTCAILYLEDDLAMIAHCGDSRVYRMTNNEVLWRTRDHSIPQDLLDIGMITEEQMAHHPDQNQLTRSININKIHSIDVKVIPNITAHETFLLCSDGFWEHVKREELLDLANLRSDGSDLERMVKLSIYRANGKSDNVTVTFVRCRQDTN